MFIMKKLFLITFAFFWYATQAQDKIVFSYEQAERTENAYIKGIILEKTSFFAENWV